MTHLQADGLLELAARAEKAGADEQAAVLARTIDALVPPHELGVPRADEQMIEYGVWADLRWRFMKMVAAEAYESAALLLVPEGFAWSIQFSDSTLGEAWLYPPDNKADVQFYASAATSALALCAASLRARTQGAS